MGLPRFLVLSQELPPGGDIRYYLSSSNCDHHYHRAITSSGKTSRLIRLIYWIGYYRLSSNSQSIIQYNDHNIFIIMVALLAGSEEASVVEQVHKPAIKLPLLLPLEPITSNKLAATRITDLFNLWQTSLPPPATSRTSAMPWRFPTLVRKKSW